MSLEDDEQSKLDSELDNLSCSVTLDDSFDNTVDASKSKHISEDSAKARELNQNDLENASTRSSKEDKSLEGSQENDSPFILSSIDILDNLISKTDSDDIRKWNRRLDNQECFSESFRPVPREVREIEDLAKLYLPSGGRGANKNTINSHLKLLDDDGKSKIKNMNSCLMKREPIIFCQKGNYGNEKSVGHLILLNKSFIIAPDHSEAKPAKSKFQDITTNISKGLSSILRKEKKYECCHNLTSIISVQAFDADHLHDPYLPSFCIKVLEEDHEHDYEIFCHSEARQKAWLDALKICIPNNYGFAYESFFSAIIFNDADLLQQCLSNQKSTINDQENVHGYTPLHLSVITKKIDYLSELLSFGAKTDVFANDDTSPLMIAKRMKDEIATDILKTFGATLLPSSRMRQERSDDNALQELTEGRKKSTTNENTDRSALDQTITRPNINFSKNMLAFQERGERLEEVAAKSSALNDEAQTYSDLTRKMKEQLEKKNKNWLGL